MTARRDSVSSAYSNMCRGGYETRKMLEQSRKKCEFFVAECDRRTHLKWSSACEKPSQSDFAFNPATLFSIVSWTLGFREPILNGGNETSETLQSHWVTVMRQEECQSVRVSVAQTHTRRRRRCIAYILYITRLDK